MVIYAHEPQHAAQIHRSVTTYSVQNSISDTLSVCPALLLNRFPSRPGNAVVPERLADTERCGHHEARYYGFVSVGHNPDIFKVEDLCGLYEYTALDPERTRSDTLNDVLIVRQGHVHLVECKYAPTPRVPLSVTGQHLADLEVKRAALQQEMGVQRLLLSFLFKKGKALLAGQEPPNAARIKELRRKIAEQFRAFLRAVYALRRVTACVRSVQKGFFPRVQTVQKLRLVEANLVTPARFAPPENGRSGRPRVCVGICPTPS